MSYIIQKKIATIFKNEVASKGFNQTSVSKIMKLGNIRRQTFYDNFQDKFDLLQWTINSMMEDDVLKNINFLSWEDIIILVFYNIELNGNFFRSVLESQTEIDIISEISSYINTLLPPHFT